MAKKKEILAGWVIDGNGGAIRKKVLLKVLDGRIVSLTENYKMALSPDCVDLSFATIVPPFIDCHVHLAMSGGVDEDVRSQQLRAGCDELMSTIDRHLWYLFSHGVLVIRDGGDRDGCVQQFRKEYDGPVQIYTPGPAFHRAGRYGRLISKSLSDTENLAEAYDSRRQGIDFVKLVNSGLNSLSQFGKTTQPQFDSTEIRQLVLAAARNGHKVMVHANGIEPVKQAVEGGCHSIEHGFFMGNDNLKLMADQGIVWVPTAVTMKMYGEVLEVQGDLRGAEIARRNLAHQLEQIHTARELGVEVALGTDAGSSGVLHGESLVDEMKLLMQGGYSLPEGIRCATSVGAQLLGLPNLGTLSAGMPADFLVARGAPAQLPRKFLYLEDIYTGGEPDVRYRKNPFKYTP